MSRQLPDEQIETFLRDTAQGLPYPPTPDIAGAVWQRLVKRGAATTAYRRRSLARHRWGVMTLSVALMLAVVLTVPEARSLVGSILRVGTSTFVVPTPTPTPTSTPMPRHTPTRIPTPTVQLGTKPTLGPTSQLLSTMPGSMTLEEAREKLTFPVRLPAYPSNLEKPDKVFIQDLDGPTLVLLWIWPGSEEKVPVVLYETSDNGERIKTKDDSTYMQVASVNHQAAQWVRGAYVLDSDDGHDGRDGQGLTYTVVQRLVGGNMLAWSENGIAYRLESTYSLPDAKHIAESLSISP